jgi:3-hydroxybutyryl-CoA dehydrogenase
MEQSLANLTLTTKIEDLKDCDIIIESIGGVSGVNLEDKALKLQVFAELDKIAKKEAIFATNTSIITIADLAQAVERKDKFIGMHWFRPANVLKAIELTYTPYTSEEVLQLMEGVCKQLGKVSVRVKDVPGNTGFIGNRIFIAAAKEAIKVVNEGIATRQDVDTVMKLGYGWTLGIFQTASETRDPRQQSSDNH